MPDTKRLDHSVQCMGEDLAVIIDWYDNGDNKPPGSVYCVYTLVSGNTRVELGNEELSPKRLRRLADIIEAGSRLFKGE